MNVKKNVKYKEDEYILGNENNERESFILNKNNEEINNKDLYNFEGNLLKNKEEKKENSDSNKESHLFAQNIIDIDNYNKNDENDKYSNIEEKENNKKINDSENNNKYSDIIINEENKNIDNNKSMEKKVSNKEEDKIKNDNKNLYIMKNFDKNLSDNENSGLKSETQILKEKEEKEENKEKKEKIESKEENDNNKNNNDSEHIIDDIIQNELKDISKENENIIENKKKLRIIKEEKKVETIKVLENERYNNDNNELIKNLILKTKEKILDDNLERIKTKNEKELANIVQYELDKNLSKLELKKSADEFKKEKLKLKSYEIKLKERNKRTKGKRYKTLENKKSLITNLNSLNENILSFYKGKKQNEYSFYKQRLDQKLEKIELINLKKNEKYKQRKSVEEERAKLNLKRSEEQFNIKMVNLKKKIEWKGLMTKVIKNMIKKVQEEKKELNKKRVVMKKEYINEMKKKDENERDKKLRMIIKKGEERKNIQNMTKRIYSSRIEKYNNMEKDRIINISKIQKILKNGEGEKEKNLDILMEEFPDNYRIIDVIKDYQIKKNEIENNKKIRLYSSNGKIYNSNYRTLTNNNNYSNKNSDRKRIFIYSINKKKERINKKKNEIIKKEERRINNVNESKRIKNEELKDDINEIYYEHELKEKIRLFKLQVYKNFLKKVKEEKNKEIMRKKQLEMINDFTLRKNLEIQFSDERALIDMRLRKENENLQKLVKDYENRLKNNYLKKQDRILNLMKEINEKKEIKDNI